ncbi:MAG: substrate-binding domain-containing protein [Candidatus Thermoplasmatota archaeon]|nr:substrate-binding domain-containing protein [Candidatus Thermoplasmatota archaeon]
MIYTLGKTRFVVMLVALIVSVSFSIGCIRSDDDELSGRLNVATNRWQATFVSEIGSLFMSSHPGSEIIMQEPGSCPAITMTGNGRYDVAVVNRDMDSSEVSLFPQMVKYTIAFEAIAFIVNMNNGVMSLNIEQLRGIFNGTYVNWLDVGGVDLPIDVVIGPESALSAHLLWRMLLDKEDMEGDAIKGGGDADVRSIVSSGSGSIGCIRLDMVDVSIRTLNIKSSGQEIPPNEENAKSGAYPLSNRIYYMTMGEPKGLKGAFLDELRSEEGKRIIAEKGYIPA